LCTDSENFLGSGIDQQPEYKGFDHHHQGGQHRDQARRQGLRHASGKEQLQQLTRGLARRLIQGCDQFRR